MKLLVYIVIIVQCHSKAHVQVQEDCTHQTGVPHSNFHIWWNTTLYHGHKISLNIETDNPNKLIDHRDVLLRAYDLQLVSDPDYRNFRTTEIGDFWVCIVISVEEGYEKAPWKMIDWEVRRGKIQ